MHYLHPSAKSAFVTIFYCNFSGTQCHIGLGVNALHTLKVLRRAGVHTDIFAAKGYADIRAELTKLDSASETAKPTHVVIEAPVWVSAEQVRSLTFEFPSMHFIVRTHSQIAFLQADANAITAVRDLMLLEENLPNLTIAANNTRLTTFLHKAYTGKCLYLPNLYDIERAHVKRDTVAGHKLLRIGSFGALRILKNHITAGAAALLIAERYRCDVEFYFSTGRDDGATDTKNALQNMYAHLPWAKLVEYPWAGWPEFRRIVAHMDLNIQLSFSESFNLTAADSCAEGVPCVVGPAIEWAPAQWKAEPDSAEAAMFVGMALLGDPESAADGLSKLRSYVDEGTRRWLSYLDQNPAALIQ
jgi:hypothetical protein